MEHTLTDLVARDNDDHLAIYRVAEVVETLERRADEIDGLNHSRAQVINDACDRIERLEKRQAEMATAATAVELAQWLDELRTEDRQTADFGRILSGSQGRLLVQIENLRGENLRLHEALDALRRRVEAIEYSAAGYNDGLQNRLERIEADNKTIWQTMERQVGASTAECENCGGTGKENRYIPNGYTQATCSFCYGTGRVQAPRPHVGLDKVDERL